MISRSIVREKDYSTREVKNLGWLLRHWKEVERIIVRVEASKAPDDDCYLTARLCDGRSYETGFASRVVCWEFLDRPVFRGLPLAWVDVPNGETYRTSCGGITPESLRTDAGKRWKDTDYR